MKPALIALALLATACASSRNSDLDEKVRQEDAITSSHELTSQITQEIDADSTLSPEQRESLKALHLSHTERLKGLNREFLQLRSVLVKDLLSSPYNEEEVSSLKHRIRKNADARVTAMFEAVDKANAILGRAGDGAKRRKMMRSFVEPQDHGIDRE